MIAQSVLKEKSELAKSILENSTPYISNKIAIQKFFEYDKDEISLEIIAKQLTIIDSYYSTNMSKRYYGIEEIAESIFDLSKSKKDLINKFIEYSKNPNQFQKVTSLFNNKYGYNKIGDKFGHATSLISKYAYFITDFNFPIYDSIVRDVYPLIYNKVITVNKFDDFTNSMNELLEFSQIDNFNQLDNFLWLIGKIKRGNYSLILKKEKYLMLINKFEPTVFKEKLKDDNGIMDLINQNIETLSDVFSPEQIEMIKFCNTLSNKK